MKGLDVSVVIPLFNKAPYIERTLRSVLDQTYRPREIIVVDDGSTDEGAEVVEAYASDKVRLLVQSNSGVSAARNRGIQSANSDWVALLDGDDGWHPRFLQSCVEATRRYPDVAAVFTNFRRDERGKPQLQGGDGPRRLEDYFRFALANRGFGMTASSVVLRRDVLLKIGAFPMGVARGEDIDTWSRVGWAGPVAYVPEVLVNYYRVSGSVTRTRPTDLKMPVDPWTRKVWPSDEEVPRSLRESGRALFLHQLRWYVQLLIEAGRKQEARRVLLEHCPASPYRTEWVLTFINTFLPAL